MCPTYCPLNVPYPPAEVESTNPCYARILSEDYAGRGGEMTAITQYFYQHVITGECCPELSDALQKISIDEMRHLDLLGELICKLGCDPLLFNHNCGKNAYWCGCNVSPTKDVCRFLEENIEGERTAIEDYQKQICQIRDCCVRKVLERIIIDEENHMQFFEQFLCCLCR